MSHENDDKFFLDLKSSLDRFDEEMEITPPGMDEIRQLVDRVEDRKKKKNDLQFLTFVILASFAVSLEALAFSRLSLTAFSILQVAAVLCFPAFLLIRTFIKQRRMEEL